MADEEPERHELDLSKLFRLDVPLPPTAWVEASPLTSEMLYNAIAQVRDNVSYEPSCGAPTRPHVVHPSMWHRIMPWEEAAKLTEPERAKLDCTICGNCLMPLPIYPEERRGFDSDVTQIT